MNRFLLSGGIAAALASTAAGAATVTIGGVALPAIDGKLQGLGTAEANVTGIETFNDKDIELIKLTGWIARGPDTVVDLRTRPKNDESRFVSVKGKRTPATFEFPLEAGESLEYIGFYWGAIDRYNFMSFLDADGNRANITGGGFDFGEEIDGVEFAVMLGGYALADLTNADTVPSLFANFYFDAGEGITRFQIRQTGIATEIDNVAWRVAGGQNISVAQVPAPGGLLLALSGLGALAALRRR